MARKRNQKSSSKNKFLSFLIILIAIGIYFYQNNPAFREKVDENIVNPIKNVLQLDSGNSVHEKNSSANQKKVQVKENEPHETINVEGELKSPAPQASTAKKSNLIQLTDFLEKPLCAGTKHARDHQLRNYDHYSICYRESYEQAEWSAYCLTEEELTKNAGRSDDFRPDPEISTGSATLADYKGSGYDRGHLSPAADFAFDSKAMSETFYMSNMSPQAGSFNRGIWKDLESQVREWAKKFGRIYVISGPVLDKPAEEYESIGANKVSIPQYYYKVVLAPVYKDAADKSSPEDCEKIAALGFILPNKKCTDSFYNYAVSIDEIEKRTGMDFFAPLEDSLEDRIEAGIEAEIWK
ncbi:MAG: DNA/RNA non-specific endonuclease [Treponema sp.]|nr:DNA/RNA non-specific endonuclease [Candidatus Treponema equifaecale]